MNTLAVIGSRKFKSWLFLKNKLDSIIKTYNVDCIVSGGAKGADSLAEKYAKINNIKFIIFEAEWKKFGKKAGFLRNEKIVSGCDILVAFWDGISKGTKHSLDIAKKMNKKTLIFYSYKLNSIEQNTTVNTVNTVNKKTKEKKTMSKWLKGKEKSFNKFKEQKKQEQEQQQAGPRRSEMVWNTPEKGTVDKPKTYELRLIPDKNNNFYKTFFYHMYKSTATGKWVFVFCKKTYGMECFCEFCMANMKLYQGSKEDKRTAYLYKRKQKHCINAYIVNDPRDADAESQEDKVSGTVKIYDFPDKIEAKIKSEMNDDAHGAGINIFDPGEDGVDFLLKVGATKEDEDKRVFPDYSTSKFSSKSNPIADSDAKIEAIMDSTHDLDEYLKSMERTNEEILKLIKTEMLWEYIKADYPYELSEEDKEETKAEEKKKETKVEDKQTFEEPPLPDEPYMNGQDISDADLLAELENL